MANPAEFGTYCPRSRRQWRTWLAKNHQTSPGVWLVYYRAGSGKPSVSYSDAVDEALCFGWIDSRIQPLDETRYMQIMTPRKTGSVWSALNKRKVEQLIADGLMMPAGVAKIEAAKKDGSWNALDAVEALTVPADFETALKAVDGAFENFLAFSRTARKQYLYWIESAKRPETRRVRIEQAVGLAARNVSARQVAG